ncbi:MAG: response regulator [Desulfobacteraceae bacterium]|nr:MAG: response regulator [Desulfobacteraceae bacterium]
MSRRCILVVDDEQAILDLAANTLEKYDYQVITAGSGEEGLDMLIRHPVDLIISDQRMGGISGIEFLKIVKKEYPNIITIMLTGFAETETAMRAVNEAGIYKFIVKPWNIADFRNTVERALDLHHLISEKDALMKKLALQKKILQKIQKEYPDITRLKETSAVD